MKFFHPYECCQPFIFKQNTKEYIRGIDQPTLRLKKINKLNKNSDNNFSNLPFATVETETNLVESYLEIDLNNFVEEMGFGKVSEKKINSIVFVPQKMERKIE